jgi:hypothetical protein
MTGGLRLAARDSEDLAVIAGCLQDAIVPVADIAYFPDERRFVLVANRFRWEQAEGRHRAERYERVNCGVAFADVTGVKSRGIDLRRREDMLSLLTVHAEPGAVVLVFAGGGQIRIEADDIACQIEDIGEPWPTQWRPSHPDVDDR